MTVSCVIYKVKKVSYYSMFIDISLYHVVLLKNYKEQNQCSAEVGVNHIVFFCTVKLDFLLVCIHFELANIYL